MQSTTDNLRLRQIQEHRSEITTYRVPAEWIPAVWSKTVSVEFLVYLGIIVPTISHMTYGQSEKIRRESEAQYRDTVTVA
jgi:hypothetical protein